LYIKIYVGSCSGISQSSTPPFDSTTTTVASYQNVHHQLVPGTAPSMVPKLEEWSNGTAYGVTPPTQVTSVNVEGIDKSSPIPRTVGNLQPATEEVNKF